jgi:hypothetical protein
MMNARWGDHLLVQAVASWPYNPGAAACANEACEQM